MFQASSLEQPCNALGMRAAAMMGAELTDAIDAPSSVHAGISTRLIEIILLLTIAGSSAGRFRAF